MSSDNQRVKLESIPVQDSMFSGAFCICVVQIKSPFWEEMRVEEEKSKLYLEWNEASLKKRRRKIEKILSEIEEKYLSTNPDIKLIIFPEYTIEKRMVKFLNEFSKKNNVGIIAGDYDIEERSNFARVILPSKNDVVEFKQHKISNSHLDREYLSPVKDENNKLLRFVWPSNNSGKYSEVSDNFFSVYVCHDFLDSLCATIDKDRAGLYVVIMCSPRIEEFYGLSYVTVRSSKGNKSNIVILCNSAENLPKMDGDNPSISCGETQIVGPHKTKENLPTISRYHEGGFIAKVNLNTSETKPTRLNQPSAIEEVIKFSLKENGSIVNTEDLHEGQIAVMNPNSVLQLLGLKKIYYMFCLKNYSRLLGTLKYLPLQVNGIFGLYDILVKSFEESKDFFDKRLTCYLGDKYNDLRDPDLPQPKNFVVTHVLKYRGIQLCDIEKYRIKFTPEIDTHEAHFFENNIDLIKAKLSGKSIDPEQATILGAHNLLLHVKHDSDLLPEEKERGFEEYLIFIDIYPSGEKSTELVNREFRKNILPGLMVHPRVRTVELCGDRNGHESHDGSYIVHLVGNLIHVKTATLDLIHERSTQIDIRCRTFVVPAADALSTDKHNYLSETILRSPHLRSFVLEMIPYMKYVDPTNPFILKQAPLDTIEKLCTAYFDYKKFVQHEDNRGELLNKFNHFIYGICYGVLCDQNLTIDLFKKIKNYCAETFLNITEVLETHFINEKDRIREELKSFTTKDVNIFLIKKISKTKSIDTIIKSNQSILGDLVALSRCWAEHIEIDDKEYVGELKKINKVVTIRNMFSHTPNKSRLEAKEVHQFSCELIDMFIEALAFVKKYYIHK